MRCKKERGGEEDRKKRAETAKMEISFCGARFAACLAVQRCCTLEVTKAKWQPVEKPGLIWIGACFVLLSIVAFGVVVCLGAKRKRTDGRQQQPVPWKPRPWWSRLRKKRLLTCGIRLEAIPLQRLAIPKTDTSRNSFAAALTSRLCVLRGRSCNIWSPVSFGCRHGETQKPTNPNQANGGWTTSRHYAVPTTDLPIHVLKPVLPWFRSLVRLAMLYMSCHVKPHQVMSSYR